jgi:hypothetical protein
MITSNETADELRARGWVSLWRQPLDKLERAGVPIKLAPCPPGEGESITTATPMAPAWAVELVTDWPRELGDPLLARVVKTAYRRRDALLFSAACLSALVLDGERAVRVLLDTPEEPEPPDEEQPAPADP